MKINSKWITDLIGRCKIMKFLEKDEEKKKLWELRLGKEFLDMTAKMQFTKRM